MKHQTRIVAKGFFGSPSPPPMTFNVSSVSARGKKKRGKLTNIKILGGDDEEFGSTPGDIFGFERLAPLVLDYRLVFPDALNQKAAWTNSAGGTDYRDDLPEAFRAGAAVGHTAAAASEYVSGTPFIEGNTGWALRFFLYETDAADAYFLLRWGSYQLVIRGGIPALMRRAGAWTQAKENSLFALLGDADISSGDQAAIDALQAEIYADYTELDLGNDADSFYGRPLTLVVLPETGGYCHVALDGQKFASAPHSEILKTRRAGVLWPDTALTLKSSGGGFFWQAGYPEFKPTGQWRLGQFKDGQWKSDFSALTYNLNKHEPAGTAINCDREEINSVFSEIVVNFSTTNPRQTPFLYWVSALVAPGERSGNDDPVFDSDDYKDDAGVGPVLNASPQYEGDDAFTIRRTSLDVEMRYKSGEYNLPGIHYHALENRLCDVYLNGALYIGDAFVKNASITSLRAATPNQAPVQVMRPETRLHLGLCDFWGIVDEMPLRADLIGDNTRLGYYLKLILRSCGFRASELAGISENAGRVLPGAALGESPCVRPSEDVPAGDYLRSLVEKYGMGRTLHLAGGVWQFAIRDTTIRAAFTTNEANHNALTYPGRWHVLYPLDLSRDFLDFYNEFVVEGAPDPVTGERIRRSGRIHESIKSGLGQLAKSYIGRAKPYPTIRDDGLRTANDVVFALRSVMRLRGRLGRFIAFETYFHSSLAIGDRVTIDGAPCEIARVSGGDLERDRMSLVCREVL